MKFGLVTPLEFIKRDATSKQIWRCICDCGTIFSLPLNALKTGNTRSCGCLNLKRIRERNTTHGLSGTKEYICWKNIKIRCYKPNCQKWSSYGGRGIKMCARWRYSFQNFIADMGRIPGAKYTIDRIDNDGDYTATNCRWITKSENVARRNHAQTRI